MALSKTSVDKAFSLLVDIAGPGAIKSSFIVEYEDEDDNERTHRVFGRGYKSDGGWENIFIHIRNITHDQRELFTQRQEEVPNSAFEQDLEKGITRIGFY